MEFFRDTHIEFMKYRRWFAIASAALLVTGILIVSLGHLNLGIDFAGGTQLTVAFQESPQVDDLRSILGEAGIGDASLQRFGEAEDNAVLIKTPTEEGSEEGRVSQVLSALDARFNQGATPGELDLNRVGTEALAEILLNADPESKVAADGEDAARLHYEEVASAVAGIRREDGRIHSWDEISGVTSPAVRQALEERGRLGAFAVLGVENVGPQIGRELSNKGRWAVILSMIGMMIYIWVRFELRFGVGALVATIHDVAITLGLYALLDYEFNLTTIAAFLTLVGYSVNDTVVIFDRVRENMRRHRRLPMDEVMDLSLNQTLSRTVLTSGTTLLVVGCLFFLGGDVIRPFAFVLMIGVITGTYSSVFIACPFALWWENLFGREGRNRRSGKRQVTGNSSA